MKTCLTIAASDSCGGAGIQADLKTFASHGVYGMSAITALTAQNTLKIQDIESVSTQFVEQQIDVVLNDIPTDSIKIGMLANQSIIQTVSKKLSQRPTCNVVLDPVMISTSGQTLLNKNAINCLIDQLIPHVDLITPNANELIVLCNALSIETGIKKISTEKIDKEKLKQLTTQLYQALPRKKNGQPVAILSKGGHIPVDQNKQICDYLITEKKEYWFNSHYVKNSNTHGTGCILSSSICANLAHEKTLPQACEKAKQYLYFILKQQLNLGQGNGPLQHAFYQKDNVMI